MGRHVLGTHCSVGVSRLGARLRVGQDTTNTMQQGREAAAMRHAAKLLWHLFRALSQLPLYKITVIVLLCPIFS